MIRLRTLGSVELETDGGHDVRAVLAQPKRLALLIYLAAARPFRVHRRDDLLALFWPDLDEARGRDALNQALRFLRQALGAEAFVKRGTEDVGLDRERVWCDVAAFQEGLDEERPDHALELYRGDFLQGFFVEESGGFEEWVERQRATLRESAARGSRRLADQNAESGALTLAIQWGRRAIDLVPDDERALRRLLRWYDRAGDRAGAFRAYEAFAKRFAEEFGAPLSAETKELVEKLRTGKPLDEGGAPARSAPAAVADAGSATPERYRIEGKLGEGGMATVYRARDLKHDRDVALKVLKPRIAESVARERFIREIRIAGRLQHPNIVPLFDSGEMDGKLFYVMPHVEGETLRERIRRQGKLDIPFVIHVLHEVAGALAYAHQQGVVHRDIKPDNILLIDRRALLTDFGIARAAQVARTPTEGFDPTLTQPGTGVGTPAYMAPEQASGQDGLDARADLYALGAVGYEMLTGRPPFTGSSPQELLAAQLTRQPEPVSTLRPDAPAPLAALLLQCLEKSPDARPASAAVLLDLLEGKGVTLPKPRAGGTRRLLLKVALGVAAAALGALLVRELVNRPPTQQSAVENKLDSTRYAILPFARGDEIPVSLPVEQMVQEAVSRWTGVRVVDRFLTNDAFAAAGSDRLSNAGSARIASGLGAGRFLRGEVSKTGDSLRIYLALYDSDAPSQPTGDGTVRVGPALQGADSTLFRVVDGLLLSGRSGAPPGPPASSRSLPARQAYSNGHSAIQEWQLARADSAFIQATRLDSTFTEAYLWLAQVRMWRRLAVSQWSFAAARAAADPKHLTPRDRMLAGALRAYGDGDLPVACTTLTRLARQEPRDFAAWYGMATCLARDSLVVRDPKSPSGWAFRSSYAQAVHGYSQAFELLSSIRRALSAQAYEPVRRLLKTSSAYPRRGFEARNDGAGYLAYPSYGGDTLGFIPYPVARFQAGDSTVVPATLARAVREQRQLFHRLAATWVAQDPARGEALEALAIATEMLGNPAALDTLARARSLAKTPEDSLRLAGAEVWMRLRFSIPNDPDGVRRARRLADSLLADLRNLKTLQPLLFVSLAVLTGRANLAAALTRDPRVAAELALAPSLGSALGPLLVFAALGGPRDSIAEYGPRTRRLAAELPDASSRGLAESFITRAATLAGPEKGLLVLDSTSMQTDYLWSAQNAFRRKEAVAVRATIDRIRRARFGHPLEDLSFDAVFPEAALLAGIGDTASASEWLGRVLDAQPRSQPKASGDPVRIGPEMRAMVLRAQLAAGLGDLAAGRRWAAVVETLWSNADPFLKATVDSMRVLARTR